MTMPHAFTRRPSGPAFQIVADARRLWRAWQDHRQCQRDMKRLEGLSDHLLRDIGITKDPVTNWDGAARRTYR